MESDDESNYELVRELGKGAFGIVYLIKHKTENEVFALKIVQLESASQAEKESAEKEAHLMSQLDHDHVVRYIESYFEGSTLFIFTEYCEGGDMAHFLEDTDGSLPEQLIVCWVYQTVSGLEYLHGKKILHRDLKPPNIYLSGEADIKLGDLGIARVLDKGADMASTMAGTPCYMSPEIFQMKGYNHKTDIWSFGCVVYELAAGHRAFDAPVIDFLVFKVCSGAVPPIQDSYSASLRELVTSMLAKDPDYRPSASELLSRSPIKEFKANPKKPRHIIKQTKVKTKWGTHQSTVDLSKRMKAMGFDKPPPFKMSYIRVPVDSLKLYRQGMVAGGGAGIYRTIQAPKGDKDKTRKGEKKVDVTLKQDLSKSEMSGGRAAVMGAVMSSLMGLSQSRESTLPSTASSMSDDFEAKAGQGTTSKKAFEAQFLMKQIELLQRHCAAGLGKETLLKAYSVLDSVTNPAQLKASLVKLMGPEKFQQYGDKIMYLRLFEVGLDKVHGQMGK